MHIQIYAIVTRLGIVKYIGQSVDYQARFKTHTRYFNEDHRAILLETVSKKQANIREKHWIDFFKKIGYSLENSPIFRPYNRDKKITVIDEKGSTKLPVKSYPDRNTIIYALVDTPDYYRCSRYTWIQDREGYIITQFRKDYKNYYYRLHRYILSAPAGLSVDHISGNLLDNRRCNLRLANQQQQTRNTANHSDSLSEYKGVSWRNDRKKWRVQIMYNDKQIYLGLFNSEIRAAQEYDLHAKLLFGQFARLNFPE